jgi:hypothetical protein
MLSLCMHIVSANHVMRCLDICVTLAEHRRGTYVVKCTSVDITTYHALPVLISTSVLQVSWKLGYKTSACM